MAADDLYMHHPQMFEIMDPAWDYQHYPVLNQNSALRTVDGPYLQITEQPKQRGFRFRYGCEGPSHGGLPGASSEKNRKTYPTVKICNYQGQARVVVQLVTALTHSPQLHAHSLVGKQCDKGICIADLQAKDSSISFPNLGILHVTKKNVAKTLEERMVEALRMGYNCGVHIHPEIDAMQGEVRTPRELTDQQRSLISSVACLQSKEMDLSVVRLMFTAFLPDSDGGFSRRLDPVVSEPIYDSKAPNASNLKIVRMDRTAGCVTGGEEVYLLCDKVQKDDIQVRFYEEDNSGATWEALGDFSPTDVHRQFAIVFKTPKYRDLNLQKPTSVFVQLKRKSDNETSEPKPFTYHPQIRDKEEVQRKRQKTLPNFQDFSGPHGGAAGGGLYRGAGPGGGGGGGYYQNFPAFNYGASGAGGGGGGGFSGGYSAGLGSGAGAKHASTRSSSDEGYPDDDSSSGVVLKDTAQRQDSRLGQSEEGVEGPPGDQTEDAVVDAARRQLEALFQFSASGNPAFLLAPQCHLLSAQDEDGDTGLHLAVLHSQQEALLSLTQVLSLFSTEELLNMRNHLYQTPLHLAILTQQKEAVDTLLLAGADPALTDRHGNTALHLATSQKVGDMTSHLLQRPEVRALMGVANTAGLCPLHVAVRANRLSALRSLLQSGADVELQERTSGRTPLHLATEDDNVSLAGCLLLEGNANVDSCTFDGSTPLHIAAGRGSAKLTALLMAAGADPLRENLEPLYVCEEEDDDEGYVPGTTPLNMAANAQVLDLLNGKEYEPKAPPTPLGPPQGDLSSLELSLKHEMCCALNTEGLWETLSHTLGLGILNNAFRLSPSPAKTLLDSYEVSGGTVKELTAALRSVGDCTALSVLQRAQQLPTTDSPVHSSDSLPGLVQDLKLDVRVDSGLCDSGVELSAV